MLDPLRVQQHFWFPLCQFSGQSVNALLQLSTAKYNNNQSSDTAKHNNQLTVTQNTTAINCDTGRITLRARRSLNQKIRVSRIYIRHQKWRYSLCTVLLLYCIWWFWIMYVVFYCCWFLGSFYLNYILLASLIYSNASCSKESSCLSKVMSSLTAQVSHYQLIQVGLFSFRCKRIFSSKKEQFTS